MQDVNTYIAQFPNPVQVILQKIRLTIQHLVPDAVETISYGMPTYKLRGRPLIYFAGFKNHIGIYGFRISEDQNELLNKLSAYKQGGGSIQFPLDQPIPFDLIEKLIEQQL